MQTITGRNPNNAVQKPKDFKLFLQEEFERRCHKNSSYSLRAFAVFLGLHHAALSLIIRGKRPLSKKMIIRIGRKLSLGPSEISNYLTTNNFKELLPLTDMTSENSIQLSIDTFKALSEWKHDAILELTRLSEFKGDFNWISQTLDIPVNEVQIAVERLTRLGFLIVDETGKWLDVSGDTHIASNEFTYNAMNKLQKAHIDKSLEALDNLDNSIRSHSSITLAMSLDDIEEARRIIRKFRLELISFLQRKEQRSNTVCVFQCSLFPITKLTKEKK